MEQYKNLSGESNVTRYQIGDNFIIVEFGDGAWYKYTYQSAGKENIEEMKILARQGQGLNSFINRVVRKRYESKG
jgi:hypothetical protein